MKGFAFKPDVEDDHLDNCIFLILLIAAKCPKSLQKPFDLKTYLSYFSKVDLSESKILKNNNTLSFLFSQLKENKRFKIANNIKLELNKEFYKRIYFYRHDWKNIIVSGILSVFILICFVAVCVSSAYTIQHFSKSILLMSLIFLCVESCLLKLFLKYYGELISSINLTNNLLEERILYTIYKISIKVNSVKMTFNHLPISRKAMCLALENERQLLKRNRSNLIENPVIEKQNAEVGKSEIEKAVVEKGWPPVSNEINILSNEYIESNEKLQRVFKEFPKFMDFYQILCSEEPKGKRKAFIVYDYETKSLKWTGNQESFFHLFFRICTVQQGVSEKMLESISEAFVHKSGQTVSCHQLQVVENNIINAKADSKDTSILYKLLEKDLK